MAEVIGQQWLGMVVEGSRQVTGVTRTTMDMVVQQASIDNGLAMQARTDNKIGQGNTGRVGVVFPPMLLVQPSPIPGITRVFRD